jgi:pyruvate,water dikinase
MWSLASSAAPPEDRSPSRPFCREHCAETIDRAGGVQVLLRGLAATRPAPASPHAVQSLDWYHPVAAELPAITTDQVAITAMASAVGRRPRGRADRLSGSARAGSAVRIQRAAGSRQRYATIREEQSRDLTMGWPVLRRCASRLGEYLAERKAVAAPSDVHF